MYGKLISIRKVAEVLGYKNYKSAFRWCINNELMIIRHNGCRSKYVLTEQFKWALYGKYLNGKSEIAQVSSISNVYIHENSSNDTIYYLSRLQNKISELQSRK